MKTISFIITMVFTIGLSLNAQELDEKLLDYDYFNHPYNFLDKDFNIKITPEKFQEFMIKYRYYPERIKTCRDSLGVVLMGEFDDWTKARIAKLQIAYDYRRVGCYLWISDDKAKSMCERYNCKYPYYFSKIFKDEDKWDDYMKAFMKNLRVRVVESTGDKELLTLNNKEFLKKAFMHNPERLKALAELKKSGTKNRCDKTDCCQSKKKK